MRHVLKLAPVLFFILYSCGSIAHAMGQGTTKIDFKLKSGDPSSSRFFAKRAISNLPDDGKKGSANDNLAGQTVTLYINSASFTGVANEKGKVEGPVFDSKVTGNGTYMHIKATGLDLETLFPLAKTDGEYTVVVLIKITATSSTGTAVTLSEENVTFNYRVKKGQVKGRNF